MIHPTALVDPAAQLGAGVEIGPYAVIGAGAVIGANCKIQAHVVIEGAVKMGERNFVGYGAIIGAGPQDLSFDPRTQSSVEIGDGNTIREYCTIHRGSTEGGGTVMGNGNFLMVGTHLGHNCTLGNGVVIANDCLLGGYARIDDRAVIGGGSMFHQHVRVGRLALVQGRTTKSIPPFISVVANYALGINVLGLRRAGLSAAERDEIKRAFKLLYRSGLNTSQAVEMAKASDFGSLGREFFDFIATAGKRGIVAYRAGLEADE